MKPMASHLTKRKPVSMKGYCSKAETLAKQDWQERSVVMEMTEHNHNTVWRTLTSAMAVAVTDGHNMKNWTGKAFCLYDFMCCKTR